MSDQQPSGDPNLRPVSYAEAISFMALGLAATDSKMLEAVSADGARAVFAENLWRSSTVVAIAKYARIGLWDWLDRPFHCWMLRRLLAEAQGSEPEELRRVERTARVFSMVHFGVDVSPAWFGRLRRVVAKGLSTEKELKRLLRSTCVLWRPSHLAQYRSIRQVPLWQRPMVLGCPEDGELRLRQPSLLIKASVLIGLTFLLACTGVGIADLVMRSLHHGRLIVSPGTMSIVLVYGCAAWGLWWIGPESWDRAARLQMLLDAAASSPP